MSNNTIETIRNPPTGAGDIIKGDIIWVDFRFVRPLIYIEGRIKEISKGTTSFWAGLDLLMMLCEPKSMLNSLHALEFKGRRFCIGSADGRRLYPYLSEVLQIFGYSTSNDHASGRKRI